MWSVVAIARRAGLLALSLLLSINSVAGASLPEPTPSDFLAAYNGPDAPLAQGPEELEIYYNKKLDAMVLKWNPPSDVSNATGLRYNVYRNDLLTPIAADINKTTFIDLEYTEINLYQVAVAYQQERAPVSGLAIDRNLVDDAGEVIEGVLEKLPGSCPLIVAGVDVQAFPYVFYGINAACLPAKGEFVLRV